MGSLTLRCSADTYITVADSLNHSAETKLKTDNWPSNLQNPVRYATVLQFTIPSELKFKKINSVNLNITIKTDIGTGIGAIFHRAYTAKSDISDLTYANYASRGTVSTPLFEKMSVNLNNPGDSYVKSTDLLEIFTNNVVNNLFTVMVNVPCLSIDDLYILSNENASGYPTLTIQYDDVLPVAPTLLYPVDVYVDSEKELTFRWNFNTLSSSIQKGYAAQWRKVGDVVWNTLSVETTSNTTYTAPAKTFPTGAIEWKLITIDEINQSSPETIAQFIVKGKPSLPVVTSVKNDALTLIEWTASDQCGYEAEILMDGIVIYKESKSTKDTFLKPRLFLDNGSYELRLRTINSYSYWSNYASKIFTINATKPPQPKLSVSINEDVAFITAEYSTNEAYLYREDAEGTILVAKLTGKKYVDKSIRCNDHSRYFVRAYNIGFTDSYHASALATTEGFVVSNADEVVNVKLSEERFIPFTEELSKEYALVEYSGRKDPVSEDGEHERQIISRSAFLTDEQYSAIRRMYNDSNIVLYRDERSIKIWCKITKLIRKNALLDTGYTVDVTFTKVDYNEGVDINA